MSLVTLTPANPLDELTDTLINSQPAAIAAVVNGNIDDTNISSVSGTKISNATITPAKMAASVQFAAYASAATGIAASFVPTKILFATEEFDTSNNFASSTFTAPQAGYYVFNAAYRSASGADGEFFAIFLYKNGALFKEGAALPVRNANQVNLVVAPPPVFLNSGDTIEVWGAQNSAGVKNTIATQSATYFGGYLKGVN